MTLETTHVAAYTGRKAPDFTPEQPAMASLTATFFGFIQGQAPWVVMGKSETDLGARAPRLRRHGALEQTYRNRKKPAQDLRIGLREEGS